MKTIKEWLMELPDGYRELALEQEDGYYASNWRSKVSSMKEALYDGVNFYESDSVSSDWWFKLVDHYQERSPLPSLPIAQVTEKAASPPMMSADDYMKARKAELLDKFAMAVIPALIQKNAATFNQHEKGFIVEWAYEYARAMAEEREKIPS